MKLSKVRFCGRYVGFACALVGCIAVTPTRAEATPLNLHSTHPGDVTTHFTDVEYALDANPNTGTLTATGFPDEFDVNAQGFISSSFALTMTVNRADGSLVSGTISINGNTNGLPHYSGLLLQGDITQFGFPNGPFGSPGQGNIFEFLAHVTGGALAAPYYGSGTAGIIMNIANGSSSPSFTGVFTAPFHNDGFNGFSDTFPQVPEPSTLVLFGLGFLPLAWRLRRRARHLL